MSDSANAYMDALNDHCKSMIQIMNDFPLTLAELKQIQLRFRAFDNLIEDAIFNMKVDLEKDQKMVFFAGQEREGKVVSDGI